MNAIEEMKMLAKHLGWKRALGKAHVFALYGAILVFQKAQAWAMKMEAR